MRRTEERNLEKLRKKLNAEIKGENGTRNKSSIHGITLIALVITIIVLLILAGVSIAMLTGNNGILRQAGNAKTKTELANLRESVEIARASFITEELDTSKTASELMYYLVDKGILKSDRTTFVENPEYSLIPNGNIMYQGEIVGNVSLTSNTKTIQDSVTLEGSETPTNIKVVIEDGDAQDGGKLDGYGITPTLTAIEAPEGYKFAYWINNYNEIVGYNNPLICNVGNIMKYTAVYVKESENVNLDNCISISALFSYTNSTLGKNYVRSYFSRNVLSGYTVIKHGILYGASVSILGPLNNIERENYMRFTDDEYTVLPNKVLQSQFTGNMVSKGIDCLDAPIGTNLDGIVYSRGYVVVRNDETGEKSIYYSKIISGSYNSLQN